MVWKPFGSCDFFIHFELWELMRLGLALQLRNATTYVIPRAPDRGNPQPQLRADSKASVFSQAMLN